MSVPICVMCRVERWSFSWSCSPITSCPPICPTHNPPVTGLLFCPSLRVRVLCHAVKRNILYIPCLPFPGLNGDALRLTLFATPAFTPARLPKHGSLLQKRPMLKTWVSFTKETYVLLWPYHTCVTVFPHCLEMYWSPLTKGTRREMFDPIISNSFPVRYYGISGTNFVYNPCVTLICLDLLRWHRSSVCQSLVAALLG